MKKKIVLSTFISVFLLSATILTSVAAQPRIPGVFAGNWFKFGTIDISWSSNDPNATFPPSSWEWLEELNETEWMLVSVEDVSDPNITFQILAHYKNGTEETSGGYVNIDTGDSENATFIAVSADLDVDDTIYTSAEWSDWRINETVIRTYPDTVRETNHLNITYELSFKFGEMQYYYYLTTNFYWDRSTGILVEEYSQFINQTGEYLTTWSALTRITESNFWVVPEFPTWTSTLLILTVLTAAIAIYKRKLLKTPNQRARIKNNL